MIREYALEKLQEKYAASNTAIARYNQAVLDAVRDVAVTGTRIKDLVEIRRRPSAGALNVTIVTRDAIERSGAGTVSEAIRRAR